MVLYWIITNRELSDFNKVGKLSKEEFILAMYLIKEKMGGKELPKKLEIGYIPPKFRVNTASLISPISSVNHADAIPPITQSTIINSKLFLLKL